MASEFTIVDPSELPRDRFPESGLHHRKLTEALGCTEMRVNIVELAPGEATAPHAHKRQEEVYLTTTGGTVRIDGDDHGVPAGGLVRIGPTPMRSVRNDGDDRQIWVMVGAPPLGTTDDFGEYVVPE